MVDKLRWGILSTARIAANAVIPGIKGAENAELGAVASRDGERAAAYAKEHGIPRSYGSYEDLLADPDIDAIFIPLPNHMHKEWAIRCAEAGKHVLCEKPIALNAAEAEEMAAAFAQNGRMLSETFQWRHHPQGQLARDLVRQGLIGELRMISGSFTFNLTDMDDIRMKPEMGGGALYDVGTYPVSLTRYITGAEPLFVTGQAHWAASGVDDRFVGTLSYPNDVLACFDCGFTAPLRRSYEIIGSEGMLYVNRAYNPRDDRPGEVVHLGLDRDVIKTYQTDQIDCYVLMVRDFSAAILAGKEPMFPALDAVKQARVLDALYAAARENRVVSMAGETRRIAREFQGGAIPDGSAVCYGPRRGRAQKDKGDW